jgi:glutamine amidotransferase
MKMLLASGLDVDPNIDAACIGNLPRMQLMCKTEEKYKRIRDFDVDVLKSNKVKVPQMGWNTIYN